MKQLLGRIAVEESKSKATEQVCGDAVVEETPAEKLQGLVAPARRFLVRGLAYSSAAKRRKLQEEQAAKEEIQKQLRKSVSTVHWCVNAYNNEEKVYIMDSVTELLVCRMGWK